jgi:preprotein translocase subunit YajC
MTTVFPFLMMGGGGQNSLASLLPMVLIIVVFYFFMIRPQMKKTKEAKQFRESLKKGDKIITIGGLHGKIVEVAETTFIIETEGGGKLRIEKSAVSSGAPGEQLQATK